MIELEVCGATQSWVNREYRRWLSTHPCGAPVLRISEVEVLFPTFTPWGRQCVGECNVCESIGAVSYLLFFYFILFPLYLTRYAS